MTQLDLHNKTICITGAGSGIGRAISMAYAKAGAELILLSKSQEKLESLYDEIMEQSWTEPYLFPMDFETAGPETYQNLVDGIKNKIGHLDGLLHNASQLGQMAAIEQYPPQDWAKTIHTNLTSPFLLTQTLLPLLKLSSNSSIIFTSSGVAVKPRGLWGAYAVSKAGTDNLMSILSIELKNTNINVFSINPGPTATAMRAQAFPFENKNELKKPADLSPAYIYLMTEAANKLSGQRLNADELLETLKENHHVN